MKKIETKLEGVYIIEPIVHGDNRGYFMETYSTRNFEELGLDYNFIQDNESFTAKKGTIRGLHFQNNPMAQAKLVRVTKGSILDVTVDIRKNSPTYLQYIMVELSAENKRMMLIPRGFAHGFKTLEDNVEFIYKCDNLYSPENDRSIAYNDPSINVDWQEVDISLLSEKDKKAPLLKDSDCNFIY